MSVFPDLRVRRARTHDDPETGARSPVEDREAQAPGAGSDRQVALQAAGMWLATRIVFAIFTYFAVLFGAQPTGGRLNLTSFQPTALLDAWNRWDANWYLQIATNGYAVPHGDIHRLGFFPLYPFVVHVLALPIGISHALGVGLAVSNGATLVGFCALAMLTADLYGARFSAAAVKMAAAYPLAFFSAAPYSDSLLFALAALSLLFARRGRWQWAALFAFIAGFDRLLAVVLVLPLAWEYLRQHPPARDRLRDLASARTVGMGLLVVGAVPLALALWSAYLGIRFGRPLGYMTAQNRYWGHESFGPWRGLQLAWNSVMNASPWTYARARVLVDVVPVIGLLGLTIATIRRIPAALSLYLASLLAVLLSSGVPMDYDPLNGEGRYIIIAIPAFILLGRWTRSRPSLDMLLTAGGFMLQGLLTAYFLRGGWLV